MKRGTINFDGKEYDIVDQPEVIVAEVVKPIEVIISELKKVKLEVVLNDDSAKVTCMVSGGSGIYGHKLGATYTSDGISYNQPKNNIWVAIIFDKVDPTKTVSFEVDSSKSYTENFNVTDVPIVEEIVVIPPVITPIKPETKVEESQTINRLRADVGVITWDWWNKSQDTKLWLSPKKYHNRLAWFAKVTGENSVEFNGATQEIIDREIEWCVDAGITYWAMNWYIEWNETADGSYRRVFFKKSKSLSKSKLKMCFILQPSSIGGRQNLIHMNNDLQNICKDMGRDDYYKVNGKPLIYILDDAEAVTGGTVGFTKRNHIDAIKSTYKELNPNKEIPYIVIMRETSGLEAKMALADNGADAWSQYGAVGTGATGAGDEKLVTAGLSAMNRYASAGVKHIPAISLGWNQSPIAENPVSWYTNATFGGERCTPETVKRFLQDALNHIKNNPSTTEANSLILYAWNENAEGGYITPLLKENGSIDTSILDAIKTVLNNTEQGKIA